MTDGVLSILPTRGLDQSILLAVLVGMLILAFFVETYGWVFVGLVVPGYLASVMVVNPAAGAAVMFEAVLTYVIVRALSDTLSATGSWSPFFGRDRFFAIVLVSVLVRQVSEIWLLDIIGGQIDAYWGTELVASRELASIGLVLVPLVANMFWKLDVPRGLVQVGVPTLLTFLILQLVLLPHTNLSLSALELTYENVALDFLGSPKAYVILVTGAYLAARANLRYGWDFNGILIPSLLALTWLSPLSIAITVVEVLILYYASLVAMRLPGLRTANLEGPRKIVLVFTVGFILKFASGWALGDRLPHLKITDLFGFGYVLTSLLAVKMLQKKVVGRVLLPTLQVSLTAFLIGNAVGYGLEQVSPSDKQERAGMGQQRSTSLLMRSSLGVAVAGAVRARPEVAVELRQGRSGTELGKYARLWQGIEQWIREGDRFAPRAHRRLAKLADSLGLALRAIEQPVAGRQAYVLLDAEDSLRRQTGWDTAFFVPGAPGPFLAIPRPLTEANTAQGAALLCESLGCSGLLISGLDRDDGGRSVADAVANTRATFRVALRELRGMTIITVRSDTRTEPGRPQLHLQHTLPPGVDLRALWPLGAVALAWERPIHALSDWESSRVLSFRVHPKDLEMLIATQVGAEVQLIEDVSIEEWLTSRPLQKNPNIVLPTETELRFLEVHLAPMLLAGRESTLSTANWLATLVGHEIVRVTGCAGPKTSCLVLSETHPIGWSTLIVREDRANTEPIALEAPRPRQERGTLFLATALWRYVRARALIVDYALPNAVDAQGNPRPNPVEVGTAGTPFQAMHQAVHRALTAHREASILQVRGIDSDRAIAADLVVSVGAPVLQERQRIAAARNLLSSLEHWEEHTRWADGSAKLAFMTGQGQPQVSYSRTVGDVSAALLWFSMRVRAPYEPEHDEALDYVLEQSSLPHLPASPRQWLTGHQTALEHPSWMNTIIGDATTFARTRNVHYLRRIEGELQAPEHRAYMGIDAESGRGYLALEGIDEGIQTRLVIFLSPSSAQCPDSLPIPDALFRRCQLLRGSTRQVGP